MALGFNTWEPARMLGVSSAPSPWRKRRRQLGERPYAPLYKRVHYFEDDGSITAYTNYFSSISTKNDRLHRVWPRAVALFRLARLPGGALPHQAPKVHRQIHGVYIFWAQKCLLT
jgi:hypothetical protein